MQNYVRLKYEPATEALHIYVGTRVRHTALAGNLLFVITLTPRIE